MYAAFNSKLADTAVVTFFLSLLTGFLAPACFVVAGVTLVIVLACSAIDLMLPEDDPRTHYSDQR